MPDRLLRKRWNSGWPSDKEAAKNHTGKTFGAWHASSMLTANEPSLYAAQLGFARKSYLPRVLGLALGSPVVITVFHQLGTPVWEWLAFLLYCFAWPHLAWQWARHSGNPFRAEQRNLLIDQFWGGAWMAVIGFNVLPTVLTVTLLCMSSLTGGGLRLLRRGLVWLLAGAAIGMLLSGFRWMPESTMANVLSCLPLLLTHPLVVAHTAHQAITKLHNKRLELEHQTRHDGLSGLYNRSHWEAQVRNEFARYRRAGLPATLVLTDIDHFKRINDDHGHEAGDEAIRRFAALLHECLRGTDVAGRYGGEEFGMLLPQTRAKEARILIERLRARLYETPLLDGTIVTASFGVAELSPDLDSHEAWMRLADQMLYRAKHQGRDRIAGLEFDDPQPETAPQAMPPARQFGTARENGFALTALLSGLDGMRQPMALLDATDRLVLTNDAFRELHQLPPTVTTYTELIRHCHDHQVGPRIGEAELDTWLRLTERKRHSHPNHVFDVPMVDGRRFRVTESTCSGWILMVLTQVNEDVPTAETLPYLPLTPTSLKAD